MIPDMARRAQELELMDDPRCDAGLLRRTVDQFHLLNRLVSRHPTVLTRWILADMLQDPRRTYHFVDIGAGRGDIAWWFFNEAMRRGLQVKVTALEVDPRISEHGRLIHKEHPSFNIVCGDAFERLNDMAPVDYVFCNHLLHHLTDEAVIRLLQLLSRTVQRRFVLSDLRRSPWAYTGFLCTGFIFRRSFTYPDGLLSIRRAFRPDELQVLVDRAHVSARIEIHRLIPGRLVLVGVESAKKRSDFVDAPPPRHSTG